MSHPSQRVVVPFVVLVSLASLAGCEAVTSLLGLDSEGSAVSIEGSATPDAGPSALPETEPNDSLAQAPNVQVGRTYTGTLAAGDLDMLRLGMGTPVALTLKVMGSSSAMVSAGPMPGSTPMAVPRKHPSSAQPRLVAVSALEKPRARPAIGST